MMSSCKPDISWCFSDVTRCRAMLAKMCTWWHHDIVRSRHVNLRLTSADISCPTWQIMMLLRCWYDVNQGKPTSCVWLCNALKVMESRTLMSMNDCKPSQKRVPSRNFLPCTSYVHGPRARAHMSLVSSHTADHPGASGFHRQLWIRPRE